MSTAFCIATGATGVCIQPIATHERGRQACKRSHFFVQIADADHVFFAYTEKETSAAVSHMFRGFRGYVQADAKSVYDILYREPERPPDAQAQGACSEVACWSHGRLGFWEATVAKDPITREELARIGRIFELDASFRGPASAQIKQLRSTHLKPHLDVFLAWAAGEYESVREQRGLFGARSQVLGGNPCAAEPRRARLGAGHLTVPQQLPSTAEAQPAAR